MKFKHLISSSGCGISCLACLTTFAIAAAQGNTGTAFFNFIGALICGILAALYFEFFLEER